MTEETPPIDLGASLAGGVVVALPATLVVDTVVDVNVVPLKGGTAVIVGKLDDDVVVDVDVLARGGRSNPRSEAARDHASARGVELVGLKG